MWKRSMVVISGAVLAVALPTAAIAMITEGGGTSVEADTPITLQTTSQLMYENEAATQVQVQVQVQEQVQEQVEVQEQDDVLVQSKTMVREQLRLHVETGPPEGTEPTQTRSREHQQLGTANPDARMGNPDAPRGNPDAPMLGDGTGECIHDGEPMGTGPHGQGTGPGR